MPAAAAARLGWGSKNAPPLFWRHRTQIRTGQSLSACSRENEGRRDMKSEASTERAGPETDCKYADFICKE